MLQRSVVTVLLLASNVIGQSVIETAQPKSASVAVHTVSSQPGGTQAQPAPEAQHDPSQQAPMVSEAAPLRVMVGKSLLINTADRLKRVSVTDPNVADALVVTPQQVMIHGRAPGEVSLLIWNEVEESRSFDLRVDVDVSSVAEEIKRIFPDQKIEVSPSRSALVLSGHVSAKEDAERAGLIAGAYSKYVVNVLTYGPVGAQEILLEVKFAEVDRNSLMQLGVNLFSTGAANTFGATSTQQFGPFTGSKTGSVTGDVNTNGQVQGSNSISGEIRPGERTLFHQPGVFGTNDLLNIFLFRSDLNLGAVIKALQTKNILQILAEPNLIAVNGKEASFLAGGEFPYPVVQGVGGLSSVTIQFKEFGVRLKFLPYITPSGNIHMQVVPEVSSLDFANGVTLSGFTVPALNTRRAETELEIQDGQSFVIAGLLDNRITNVMSKLPGLGDLPVLGTLFKSKNLTKNKTELMVLVTARKVSPTTQPPPFPNFPETFMDQKKNDSKPAAGGK